MGDAPKGLPGEADHAVELQAAREAMITCPDCGQKGRTVTNSGGVNVFCNQCKKHWPISSTPRARELPVALPRGLSKQTLVEPDWSLAEGEVGDVTNEQVGPKRR
jgi:hypothetical protein